MKYDIRENERFKLLASDNYNYRFDKRSGLFIRWGKTLEDDPSMAPGPEIMDLEISTVCHGPGKPCRFCYKANTSKGEQMSFATFRALFDKMPKTLTQVAFGIGDVYGHDDMWLMFDYARQNGVIPNITINGWGLTDEIADRLVKVMGAVSVSRYDPKDTCYDAVKMLTDRGMKQVNIHQVVSEDTYESCLEVLADRETDPRLAKLNAVVFLMLKPKGRADQGMARISDVHYREIVEKAQCQPYMVGFDSCSAPSFTHTLIGKPGAEAITMMVDPCESGLFSIYANVHGDVYPCSFTEGTLGWEQGISILDAEDFESGIWNHPRMDQWRARLLGSSAGCGSCSLAPTCRSCPVYEVDTCKR